MNRSTMAQQMADIFNQEALQSIIDNCKVFAGTEGLTVVEGEMYSLAAMSLTAILEMQTKQEN